MAKKQQKSILDTLEPYHKQIQLAIPGNRLFDTYTFKSQIVRRFTKTTTFRQVVNDYVTRRENLKNYKNSRYITDVILRNNIVCFATTKSINNNYRLPPRSVFRFLEPLFGTCSTAAVCYSVAEVGERCAVELIPAAPRTPYYYCTYCRIDMLAIVTGEI